VTIPSLDSVILEFQFSPSSTGIFNEVYPVNSNDTEFSGINVTGTSYAISTITEKTIYASSGVQNSGNLLTVNSNTGAGTVIGPTLFDEVKSVSINPLDGKLYGIISETAYAKLLKLNAATGNAYHLFTFNIPSMTSIAFDTAGVLYGITRTGDLYTLDITNGSSTFLVNATGSYLGITFNPVTNELWATSRAFNMPNKDAIFKVNISTGDTTIVGHTGLGKQTNDIVFDENNNLYGVIGSASELNDIISINTSTGAGSVIGSVGMKHILSLAYLDQFTTDIDENQNNEILPADFVLSQNYPNPFNPSTTINFSLPVESDVKLVIYNILGQELITLLDEQMTAGNHSVNWNAMNNGRKHLTSGIYFYKITANGVNGQKFQDIKKMILIK
ncbi:MAG: T9SS type A sorting domain-containing protein, partial [Ignavibacterium sp.]